MLFSLIIFVKFICPIISADIHLLLINIFIFYLGIINCLACALHHLIIWYLNIFIIRNISLVFKHICWYLRFQFRIRKLLHLRIEILLLDIHLIFKWNFLPLNINNILVLAVLKLSLLYYISILEFWLLQLDW